MTPRTLCLPGSSVPGILQARILTWDEKLCSLGWPGPKDLKGSLLAAPGWLWEGPCHHLFITPWGMPALANPAQRGQSGDSPLSPASSPPQLCGSACGSCQRTCSVVIRLHLDRGLAVQSQASVTHCWQYKGIVYLKKNEYWSGLPLTSPGESSRPRDWILVFCIAGRFFPFWATKKPPIYYISFNPHQLLS